MDKDLERGGEKGEKIMPNNFGGSVGYVILAQNFIDDQLVMKIKTEDLSVALEAIKEENPNKEVAEFPRESKPDQDIYIIKVS